MCTLPNLKRFRKGRPLFAACAGLVENAARTSAVRPAPLAARFLHHAADLLRSARGRQLSMRSSTTGAQLRQPRRPAGRMIGSRPPVFTSCSGLVESAARTSAVRPAPHTARFMKRGGNKLIKPCMRPLLSAPNGNFERGQQIFFKKCPL